MSQENVDLVRRATEAVTRKPKPDFDTVNALFHPYHEWVSMISALDGESLIGAGGFREWLTTAKETWGSFEWQFEECSEIDDNRVLVVQVFRTRTRRGGVPIEQRLFALVTVRDGKLTRTETYSSREVALEAAGLEQ